MCIRDRVKEPGCYPIDSDDSMFVYKGLPSDLSLLALSSNKAILDQVSLAFRNTYMILVLLAACGIILILCSMRITYWPLHRLLTKLVDKPLPGRSYVDVYKRQSLLPSPSMNTRRISSPGSSVIFFCRLPQWLLPKMCIRDSHSSLRYRQGLSASLLYRLLRTVQQRR